MTITRSFVFLLYHCLGGVGNVCGDFGFGTTLFRLVLIGGTLVKYFNASRAADSEASSLFLHGFPMNILSPGTDTWATMAFLSLKYWYWGHPKLCDWKYETSCTQSDCLCNWFSVGSCLFFAFWKIKNKKHRVYIKQKQWLTANISSTEIDFPGGVGSELLAAEFNSLLIFSIFFNRSVVLFTDTYKTRLHIKKTKNCDIYTVSEEASLLLFSGDFTSLVLVPLCWCPNIATFSLLELTACGIV